MKHVAHNTKEEEKYLVSQILKGDEKALRYFYHKNAPKVLNFIKKKIGEEKDAEEILQDTFLATLEAMRDFTFRCSLNTFLCSIAKRKIADFYRKKKIEKVFFSQVPQIESLLAILTTPEDKLDEKLIKHAVEKAFKKLQPKHAKILHLKYIEGFSVLEIAEKFSISFKSAESMLFRARQEFAKSYNT